MIDVDAIMGTDDVEEDLLADCLDDEDEEMPQAPTLTLCEPAKVAAVIPDPASLPVAMCEPAKVAAATAIPDPASLPVASEPAPVTAPVTAIPDPASLQLALCNPAAPVTAPVTMSAPVTAPVTAIPYPASLPVSSKTPTPATPPGLQQQPSGDAAGGGDTHTHI